VLSETIQMVRAMTEQRRYRAYLLRLWQADDADGCLVWRASLEDARTGERRGFADLSRLCAFLEQQAANSTGRAVNPPDSES
jgi:hypothetical protein